jgi:hypothetical protein
MKSGQKNLTTHQWRLYDYLNNLVVNEKNRSTTVEELVNVFPEEYGTLDVTDHNKSNCPKLYEDLKAITMTDEVDMIVTPRRNHIRLGTELDVLKRLQALTARTRWEEKEIRQIKAKIKRNRQMKLLSNAGVPIDEASPDTKAWHVAFSDQNIALTIKQLEKEEKERSKANGNS